MSCDSLSTHFRIGKVVPVQLRLALVPVKRIDALELALTQEAGDAFGVFVVVASQVGFRHLTDIQRWRAVRGIGTVPTSHRCRCVLFDRFRISRFDLILAQYGRQRGVFALVQLALLPSPS